MKTRMYVLIVLAAFPLFVFTQTPELFMSLKVNHEEELNIQRGYSVILGISLFSSQQIPYDRAITYLPDSIKADSIKLMRIDALLKHGFSFESEKPWWDQLIYKVSAENQGRRFDVAKVLLHPMPNAEFNVHLNKAENIFFGIDPEITKQWRAGEIRIISGFPIIPGQDTIWSNEVIINVQDPELRNLNAYSDLQLDFVTNYWIKRNMCDTAEIYAKELYTRNDAIYTHTALLAEVYRCQNKLSEALMLYYQALEQFEEQALPEQFPPAYFYDIIMDLQNKLHPLD